MRIRDKLRQSQKLLIAAIVFIAICIIYVIAANLITTGATKSRIHDAEYFIGNDTSDEEYDAIIVLGCGIYDNSIPTPLMSDRLDVAINLYASGVAPKLLMSGDHSSSDYNEVAVMRDYAISRGVPEEDIILDHSGFSTYESMYRASRIFDINRAIVVTQEYHLYRALFLAEAMGIDAQGAVATGHEFRDQWYFDTREYFARAKDLIFGIIKPEVTI